MRPLPLALATLLGLALVPDQAYAAPGRGTVATAGAKYAPRTAKRRYYYYRRYANPAIVRARQTGKDPGSQVRP